MARTTVGGIVREAIRGKAEIGIGELYRAVASHENAPDLSQSDMRHRVRSAVHTLSKEGVLARVGDGVYAVRGHGGE